MSLLEQDSFGSSRLTAISSSMVLALFSFRPCLTSVPKPYWLASGSGRMAMLHDPTARVQPAVDNSYPKARTLSWIMAMTMTYTSHLIFVSSDEWRLRRRRYRRCRKRTVNGVRMNVGSRRRLLRVQYGWWRRVLEILLERLMHCSRIGQLSRWTPHRSLHLMDLLEEFGIFQKVLRSPKQK